MPEILSIDNLHTHYFTQLGIVKAVDGCSIALRKGEALGIAGESGCGKSTLSMSILRLIHPPHRIVGGEINFKGTNLLEMGEEEFRRIRWEKISMVFQQSMCALNPVLRISEQIIEPVIIKKTMIRTDAEKKACELLELVGVSPSRIKDYPHEFSGGMRQRALIAMSLICNPEIVILDEPTTALDVVSQHMILGLMNDLQKKMGLSIIWITHDLAVLSEICDRITIMYAGRVVETGRTSDILHDPKHPYTIGLLESFPTLNRINEELRSIPGTTPDLMNLPSGCRFHPRCRHKTEICEKVVPKLEKMPKRADGFIECHHWEEIESRVN